MFDAALELLTCVSREVNDADPVQFKSVECEAEDFMLNNKKRK